MGVLDEIKDTVSGSDSGKKKSRSSPSQPKKGSGSSISSDSSFSTDAQGGNNLGGNGNDFGNDNLGGNSGSQKGRGQRSGSGGNSGQQSRSFPNSQAGRPQQGSDQPQLSSNTRKKMENAGLKPSNDQRGGGRGGNSRNTASRGSGGGRNSQASVSQDDFEDLKAQNQRIIELLQNINQNLQR